MTWHCPLSGTLVAAGVIRYTHSQMWLRGQAWQFGTRRWQKTATSNSGVHKPPSPRAGGVHQSSGLPCPCCPCPHLFPAISCCNAAPEAGAQGTPGAAASGMHGPPAQERTRPPPVESPEAPSPAGWRCGPRWCLQTVMADKCPDCSNPNMERKRQGQQMTESVSPTGKAFLPRVSSMMLQSTRAVLVVGQVPFTPSGQLSNQLSNQLSSQMRTHQLVDLRPRPSTAMRKL